MRRGKKRMASEKYTLMLLTPRFPRMRGVSVCLSVLIRIHSSQCVSFHRARKICTASISD